MAVGPADPEVPNGNLVCACLGTPTPPVQSANCQVTITFDARNAMTVHHTANMASTGYNAPQCSPEALGLALSILATKVLGGLLP